MAKSLYHESLKRKARPRALKMLKLRQSGKTWPEIGEIFGVTKQRAQALVKAHTA